MTGLKTHEEIREKKSCKPIEEHEREPISLEEYVEELKEENRKIKGINKGLQEELAEFKDSYDGLCIRHKNVKEELAEVKMDIDVALNERDRHMRLRDGMADELEKVKAEAKAEYDELYIEVENLKAANNDLSQVLAASREETKLANYKRNVLLESIKSLAQTSQFLGGDK